MTEEAKAVPEVPEVPATPDYESIAREQGWVPEDEWEGAPDQWKTAEKFVEDGKNILPLVQKRLEKAEGRIEQLNSTNAELKQFFDKALDKQKRANAELRKELERQRVRAVTEGDGQAFQEAEDQLRQLDQEDSAVQQNPELPPGGQEWLDANEWYATPDRAGDSDLTAFADGVAERIRAEGYTGKAYFNEITRRTQAAFPQKFGQSRRSAPSVETDGEPKEVSDPKARSFKNLPREAQEQCKRFEKTIPNFSRDTYLENYDWE